MNVILSLGWTLVQFLWQGTVIAVVYAMIRRACGDWASAATRYRLACGALAMMVAAPVLTFFLRPELSSAAPVTPWPLSSTAQWNAILPWMVAAWLTGVTVFSARLIAGWRVSLRMRSRGVRPAPEEWQRKFAALAARTGVTRPVRLLVSSLVEVPAVVGWLRPVVLAPVGALTGLPVEHLEALLAHELAHIRRKDYFVNVLQSVAEALLFYHPAVWWISDQIRAEREICCDSLAVEVCGDVLTYAHALAELESCRPSRPRPAIAANGGSLAMRIARLIGVAPMQSHHLPGPGAVGAMTLLWLLGIGGTAAHSAQPARPASAVPETDVRSLEAEHRSLWPVLLFSPLGPAPQKHVVAQAAAEPRQTTATVEGTVTTIAGAPVRNASVWLAGVDRWNAHSDESGHFVFQSIPPGRYTLEASHPGFLRSAFAAPAPGAPAPSITLEAGTWLRNAVIRMTIEGVIRGQVLDQANAPIANGLVVLYRTGYVRGRMQLQQVGTEASADGGYFEFGGLTPSKYYLCVRPPSPFSATHVRGASARSDWSVGIALPPSSARSEVSYSDAFAAGYMAATRAAGLYLPTANEDGTADVTTFYPTSLDLASASPLDISPGTRLDHINVHLRRERVYSMKGRVVSNGGPVANSVVTLTHADSGAILESVPVVVQQGVFEVGNLPEGAYTVSVPSEVGMDARTQIAIGNLNPAAVVVTAQPSFRLSGLVRLEDGDASDGLSRVRILFHREDSGTDPPAVQARVKVDGTFESDRIGAGKCLLELAGLPDGMYVKSVRYGSAEFANSPLDVTADGGRIEIVLSTRSAAVSGTLRDNSGQPLPGVTVAVWPRTLNFGSPTLGVKTTSTDQNGTFQVAGLPPGDYNAAAWEGQAANSGVFQVPGLLTRFAPSSATLTAIADEVAQTTVSLIGAAEIASELSRLTTAQ